MIPVEISFKVLADGGFFIDEEGLSSGESWETVMKRIFQMQQVEGMARIHAKSDEIWYADIARRDVKLNFWRSNTDFSGNAHCGRMCCYDVAPWSACFVAGDTDYDFKIK